MLTDTTVKINLQHRASYDSFRPDFKMDLLDYNHKRPDIINNMGNLKENKNYTFIFDMETDGFLRECTKIHCIALTTLNGDTSLFAGDDIPMALEHLANAECIIGHNIIGFDIPVIQKLYPKWRSEALVRDTLVLSRLAYPNLEDLDYRAERIPKKARGSHSLKAWGYRLGTLKGDFNDEDTDWSTYTLEMGEYCIQDTIVTLHLANRLDKLDLTKRSIEIEHEFALNIHNMCEHGVGFDSQACGTLYGLLLMERGQTQTDVDKVAIPKILYMKTPQYYTDEATGDMYTLKGDAKAKIRKTLVAGPLRFKTIPFNPNSRPQIAEFLMDTYGWEPTEYTDPSDSYPEGQVKISEEVLDALSYPMAATFSRYMMLTKRISQVAEGKKAWLKTAVGDRIHGYVNPSGALSSRCTHSNPNTGQIPSVRKEFGTECRRIFNVPAGYKMVGADMSGLELRCLAHFLHAWDEGEYTKEILSGDIHAMNQWAAGLDTRDQAKTFIYAFLYGAGNALLGEIVGGGEREGKILRNSFLTTLPALKSLLKAVKNQSNKHGWIRALDGRKIPTRSDHSALNLVMQSTGSILMKEATNILMKMIDIEKLDAKLVLHVHDEVQLEVIEAHAERVGKLAVYAMKKAGHNFGLNCPTDGEFKIGNNWAETH